MERFITMVIFAMIFALGASAQIETFLSPQVFISLDTDASQGWTTGFTNMMLEDLSGGMETLDLTTLPPGLSLFALTPVGFGQYGIIYAEGNYLIEPFHYSQAYGNHQGIMHVGYYVQSFAVYGYYEDSPGVGPFHRQGLRLARADGQPFILRSLDYKTSVSDFCIGYQLTNYSDTAAWSNAPTITGSANWQTLNFEPRPYDIAKIRLASASPVIFNSALSTFTAQASIASFVRTTGAEIGSAAVDPLVGGTITVSGTYSGSDTNRLSDISLSPAAILLATPGGSHQLAIAGNLGPSGGAWRHGAVQGFPEYVSGLTTTSSLSAFTSGTGSEALQGLAIRVANMPITLRFIVDAAGPHLESLDRPYVSPPGVGQPSHVWTADGQGGLAFAAINLSANAVIRNLFAPNPVGPLGAGSFLGLDFTPILFDQFLIPPGTAPLHDMVTVDGTYFWAVAPGSLPAGLSVDIVLIELPSNSTLFTAYPVDRLAL